MRSIAFAAVSLLASVASAQTYNSMTGGWNTGYGHMYGSFGYAMATQSLYNSIEMNIQRSMLRQSLIKKHGLAAVEKAERDAKAGKRAAAGAPQVTAPPPAARGVGRFKPDPSVNVPKLMADELGKTPEEKKLIAAVAQATKQAFESQPETKEWRNNVAGALAFFMLSNVSIYRNDADPSDEAAELLFQAVSLAVDSSPEIAKASNKEKQQLYDMLLGLTGIPLAVATDAKERKDAEQEALARELAGKLLELVLKIDPAKATTSPQQQGSSNSSSQ
jgi:hypothetical protein